MTTSASYGTVERRDVRTILTAGISLGLVTVAGVAVFGLLSRLLSGVVESVVQSLIVLAGGALAMYLPARAVRPVTIDAIGWSAFVGVIGAWTFTLVDIAILRPAGLYHWTWDRIGGGSGWWYLPVWWMGGAFLAWLGAWAYASRAVARSEARPLNLGLQAAGVAIAVAILLDVTGITTFGAATAALAFGISAVLQVPLVMLTNRR